MLAPSATVLAAAGDPDAPMLPRSANKPLQLVGMLRAGLALAAAGPGRLRQLALGRAVHVRRVRDLLAGAGVPPSRAALPAGAAARRGGGPAVLRAGGGPERVT